MVCFHYADFEVLFAGRANALLRLVYFCLRLLVEDTQAQGFVVARQQVFVNPFFTAHLVIINQLGKKTPLP